MEQAIGSVLFAAVFMLTWSGRIRFGVMRLLRDGKMVADPGGKLVSLWWDHVWLAQFSEEWRAQYGSTFAFGYGRDKVWFYTPGSIGL